MSMYIDLWNEVDPCELVDIAEYLNILAQE
jgi:hypothetical protein